MVIKYEKIRRVSDYKHHIKADVIVLGCSLPGIVTAHNLKQKFGASMDIMVLDLTHTSSRSYSHSGVMFKDIPDDDEDEAEVTDVEEEKPVKLRTDNVARYYFEKYSRDLRIPETLLPPKLDSSLSKLFQYTNGSTVRSSQSFHDFKYLNFIERFELLQFQNLLDYNMMNLFTPAAVNTEADRRNLLYFDQTPMERYISNKLMLHTSREIMRTIVRLVCGTTADEVSVLFYLHQCFRCNSSRNQADGDNTRLREKLMGRFRKRLKHILKQSVADITMATIPIKEIRTTADERVILEPVVGETDYRCTLLAMAIRPDQLQSIQVERDLLAESDRQIAAAMSTGVALKFTIQYEKHFWRKQGYSGDILSVRGPILWAMERPKISVTRSTDKYAALIGYLKIGNESQKERKMAVLEQLVKLFGEEASKPVSYNEAPIEDIFVPRCGDYVALRRLTTNTSPKYLEWAALDIYSDGDVAAAVEAGHTAYLHLLSILRPQAINFEDVSSAERPVSFIGTLEILLASINLVNAGKIILFGAAVGIGVQMFRNWRKT